jgi:hypothetical protein
MRPGASLANDIRRERTRFFGNLTDYLVGDTTVSVKLDRLSGQSHSRFWGI